MSKTKIVAVVFLYMLPMVAHAQDTVCTLTRDAVIVKPFMTEEYQALMHEGLKEEAAKDVFCTAPKGSKVVIADFGAAYVSAHVVTGPQKDCIGNLLRGTFHCGKTASAR